LDVVHSSKMTTLEVEFEFWEKRKKSHGIRSGEYVAAEPLKCLFWPKIRSRRWQCDREHCRDAASKCPQTLAGHDELFFLDVQGPHDSTVY